VRRVGLARFVVIGRLIRRRSCAGLAWCGIVAIRSGGRELVPSQSTRQSSGSERPRHWNYKQADAPDFASFAEPFSAGWNAHRREGDVDGQAFARLLMDAYNASGAMLAHKVATGAMTEEAARAAMAERTALTYVEDLVAESKKQARAAGETP
jgi:hypothetical protein